MNHCEPFAYVIGPHRQLSDDPTEHDWGDRMPAVGCNHLVCTRCKGDVKVLPSSDRERRVYACTCFEHSESQGCWTTEEHWTQFGDRELQTNLPWTCAGHPPAELPARFGDQTIGDRAELVTAIVEAASDETKSELVLSLHHRTTRGSLEGIVPEALAAASASKAPLSEALKQLLARNPALAPLKSFAQELGHASRERRAQLVDILAHSYLYRSPGVVDETITLLRGEALKGAITAEQLRVLSSYDMEWLVAHLDELVARGPEHAGPILAWGGRALLMNGSFSEDAVRKTQALARKTKLSVDTLIERVETASGIWPAETRAVIEALKRMHEP